MTKGSSTNTPRAARGEGAPGGRPTLPDLGGGWLLLMRVHESGLVAIRRDQVVRIDPFKDRSCSLTLAYGDTIAVAHSFSDILGLIGAESLSTLEVTMSPFGGEATIQMTLGLEPGQ